jgi:CRP-like cAMP-binding protein
MGADLQPQPVELRPFVQQLFACSTEVAERIARHAADRRFTAGAVILRQGDALSDTYLLVLGRARALAYGREGQLVLLHDYAPGDIFGAVADARPGPSEAEVVAVDETRAAVFLALDFLGLMEAHSCIGLVLSRMLLRRLQAATDRMVERTTLSAVGRVYAELLRLADLADGRAIRPAPVLSALAVRVQTTRETASRAVSDLERRGIVRRDGEALTIVARRRLEDLVV